MNDSQYIYYLTNAHEDDIKAGAPFSLYEVHGDDNNRPIFCTNKKLAKRWDNMMDIKGDIDFHRDGYKNLVIVKFDNNYKIIDVLSPVILFLS